MRSYLSAWPPLGVLLPARAAQIRRTTGDRDRSLAGAGPGYGARAIGTWRGRLPAATSRGPVRRASTFRAGGAALACHLPRLLGAPGS